MGKPGKVSTTYSYYTLYSAFHSSHQFSLSSLLQITALTLPIYSGMCVCVYLSAWLWNMGKVPIVLSQYPLLSKLAMYLRIIFVWTTSPQRLNTFHFGKLFVITFLEVSFSSSFHGLLILLYPMLLDLHCPFFPFQSAPYTLQSDFLSSPSLPVLASSTSFLY